MRVVVTGQVGMDKKAFLQRAVASAPAGESVDVFHVGERMYAEAPDVAAGRILDLSLGRLNALRRSVFKDILAAADTAGHLIVNTHATFRWRHGLFYAFDYDMMKDLAADLYVVVVDNIDRVHGRLVRDGHADHTLKDLMVWREEEALATELLAQIVRPKTGPARAPAAPGGRGNFFILARGSDTAVGSDAACDALAKLMFAPDLKTAYLSFPMSHVVGDLGALAAIDRFRSQMKRHFICFDPGDVEEKPLAQRALAAAEAGRHHVAGCCDGREIRIPTGEVLSILPDIDGQIYARDFKLIDQSDMIVSLVPEAAGGPESPPRPAISSGVERELQHAHEAAKEVFVIWVPQAPPSPFVTETATRVFASVGEAVEFFHANGYVPAPRGGLFG